MVSYVFRKVTQALVTLFLIALITFLMGRAVPGGPFDGEKVPPPHIKHLMEAKYGFDKPPLQHFFTYMKDVVTSGDFGVSLKFRDRLVTDIILQSLPVSLSVGVLALLFSLLLGVPLGILSVWRPNSWLDTTSMFLAVSGVTLPTFFVGALLVIFFCHFLEWLPPARLDGPEYFILPVITLGTRPAAIVARLIRASLLDEMKLDYIRTARAKGLQESKVLLRHAFRNSLLPVVTVLAPITANILTGSFITEHFFAIPGMAKYFIDAVTNRDVFLMMGVTLVFASLLILISLLVDLVYPVLDPRIKLK